MNESWESFFPRTIAPWRRLWLSKCGLANLHIFSFCIDKFQSLLISDFFLLVKLRIGLLHPFHLNTESLWIRMNRRNAEFGVGWSCLISLCLIYLRQVMKVTRGWFRFFLRRFSLKHGSPLLNIEQWIQRNGSLFFKLPKSEVILEFKSASNHVLLIKGVVVLGFTKYHFICIIRLWLFILIPKRSWTKARFNQSSMLYVYMLIFFDPWYSHCRNSLEVWLYLIQINIFGLCRLQIHRSLCIFNSHWFRSAMMCFYFIQFSWVKKCLQFFYFEVWYRRRTYKLFYFILTNPHFSGVPYLWRWANGSKKVAIIVLDLNGLLLWIRKMEGHIIISCCLLYFCVISGPVH